MTKKHPDGNDKEVHQLRQRIKKLQADMSACMESYEALRDSERRYRSLWQNLKIAVFRTDPDRKGKFLHANSVLVKLLGYDSLEKVAALEPRDIFVNYDDKQQLIADLEREGTVHSREFPLRKRDGSLMFVSCTARAVFDDSGRISWIDGILKDITEHKLMEQELIRSESRYKLIADSSADMIWTMNMDQRFTYTSSAMQRLFGFSVEEAASMDARQILTDESYAVAIKRFKYELAQEEAGTNPSDRSISLDLEHKRKDGSTIWCEVRMTFLRDKDGKPIGIQGVSRDITKRREANEALRRSEHLYRTTIDSVDDAIHVVGLDMRFSLFNSTFRKWCRQYHLETDVPNPTMFDFFPFLTDKIRDEYRQVLDTGKAVATEEYTTVGDKQYCTETRKTPVFEGGKIVRFVTVVRDITERKKAQQALEVALGKLVNARETESRRLARELHDSVGQSLVGMQLSIQNIIASKQDVSDQEKSRHCLGIARKCGELVREIRRICHGLYPPALESLGLVPALRKLGRICEPNVQFELLCPSDLTTKRFGPEREIALFRIAQESLSNALRHGKARKVVFDLKQVGNDIRLIITDDGCGFDVDDKARPGLGLRSMTERAHALGGTLEITSRRGQTRINACIPENH